MIDITEYLKEAISSNILWSISERNAVLDYLRSLGYVVDFSEDENNWAIVSKAGMSVSYIWARYPLLFMKDEGLIINLKNKFNALIILKLNAFDEENLSVDFEEVKDYLDYVENTNKFSVADLWFYTNSR